MGDHGTLYQLRNKLNHTNVMEKPKNDVNACEDFLEIVTSGLIAASALTTTKLASTNDTPGTVVLPEAESIWIMPDSQKSECLKRLCAHLVSLLLQPLPLQSWHQQMICLAQWYFQKLRVYGSRLTVKEVSV